MSFKLVNDFPNEILNEKEEPFISLYQPTHRYTLETKQDIIRFKNLIRRIEDSLKEKYPKKEIGRIMEPFYELAEDVPFWNRTFDGLAILATSDRGVMYKLQRTVKELAVVADSFHIKPLIRIFQSADRYQLLGLNRREFALYEGNRYGFEEIEMEPGTPRTIEDILGMKISEKDFSAGVFSSDGRAHSYGERKEIIDKYTEKFFRYVDQFVWENYSRPSGLPLMLVALPEYHSIFQNISRNPYLMKDGIKVAFNAVSMEELKETVWEKIEPLYLDKTKKLVDRFETARAKFLASDDLAQIARAAWENRVATLLVESDRIIPGKVDLTTGELIEGDLEHPEFDDLLDDLAEIVFKRKGEVVVLPQERMPTTTGAAAIYRY